MVDGRDRRARGRAPRSGDAEPGVGRADHAAPAHGPTPLRRAALLLIGGSLAVVAVAGLGAIGLWLVAGEELLPARSAPAASSDGYTVWDRNDDGTPVRWNACEPVELVVSAEQAPRGAMADLEVAVERLRAASGLDLVIAGDTRERPSGERLAFQPERYGRRWAPILVAWAAPGESGLPLRDTDRGIAVPVAVGPDGARVYVTGQVVLNAERDDLVPGYEDRSRSWGATILHELAHVLGLGHVDDPDELMHVFPGEGSVELGPGDRAGLAAVGDAHACLDTPRPRPVEVTQSSSP